MINSILEKKMKEATSKKQTQKAFGDLLGHGKKGRPQTSDNVQYTYKCPKDIHDDYDILCLLNVTNISKEIRTFIQKQLDRGSNRKMIENINETGKMDGYVKRNYGGHARKIKPGVKTVQYTYRVTPSEYNDFMTLCKVRNTNVGTEIRLMMEKAVSENKDRIEAYKKGE